MERKCKHCGIDMPDHTNGYQCNTCRLGLGRYGLNRLDQIKLWESQSKKCALCEKEIEIFSRRKASSAYVDHCHETGKVRAFLCHPCNTSIGYLENTFGKNLDKVQSYLRLAQLD
jgi:hypothetical protein